MYEQYIPAPAPSKTEFNLFNSEMTKVIIGNTSTDNVATGEYVSLKKSIISGLSDGIYKSKSNIASGTPFVSSNLEAVTGGAVNALNDGLDELNGKIGKVAIFNISIGTSEIGLSGYDTVVPLAVSGTAQPWATIDNNVITLSPGSYVITYGVHGYVTGPVVIKTTVSGVNWSMKTQEQSGEQYYIRDTVVVQNSSNLSISLKACKTWGAGSATIYSRAAAEDTNMKIMKII